MAPMIIMVHCNTSVKNTAVKPPARVKGKNFDPHEAYLTFLLMLGEVKREY